MFSVTDYLNCLQLDKQQVTVTGKGLFNIHQAHFYNIPYSNLDMRISESHQSDSDYMFEKIIMKRRGGICYDFCAVVQPFLTQLGFSHRTLLARVKRPVSSSTTHQILLVNLEGKDWLLDIGFGAKGPRSPLLLQDGYIHEHPFLSSKVKKGEEDWLIYIKEKINKKSEWQLLYSFHDHKITQEDIEMAYFYTAHSPKSPFTQNYIVSLPTQHGRISLKDNIFTEITSEHVEENLLTEEQLTDILAKRFAMR